MLLSGAGDTAGDTLATATDLGFAPSSVGAPVNGQVGAADTDDFFKIRTAVDGKLFVRGTYTYGAGATTGVGLQIIKDADNDGVIDPGETLTSLSPAGLPADHAVEIPLASGAYYVRFTGTDVNPDGYALTFSLTQIFNGGGRKIAYARELGRLSSFSAEALLTPETSDWYSFTIGRQSDLSAILGSDQSVTPLIFRDGDGDREIDPGETLTGWTRTTNGAHKQDQLAAPLKPGTYYVRVSSGPGADSAYLLSLEASPRLGQLEAGLPLTVDAGPAFLDGGSLGGAEVADFWRFSLASQTRVSMSAQWSRDYDNPGFDPFVEWIQDKNGNGTLDAGEVVAETGQGFAVDATLAAGNWYARVTRPAAHATSPLTYQIGVHTIPDIAAPQTYRTATVFDAGHDLNAGGAGIAAASYQGGLPANASRYHAFKLDRRTGVRGLLGYMTANANLQLLRDVDGNGKFSDADVVISSSRGGVKAERINAVLDAGTYLFRVVSTGAATDYQLTITAVQTPEDEPGATLLTALPVFLGVNPVGPPFMDQMSGGDRRDYYKITLNFTEFFRASVESLVGDVDISLVRDANGNGVVDPGEVLSSSSLQGEGLTDALRYKFAPGAPTDNVYLRVYRASAGPAEYQLNFG